MPNDHMSIHERRIWASWCTRACAAGWCVGTQIFLAGCAVGMPLALNSTWLAALTTLPFCAWLVSRSHRHLQSAQEHAFAARLGYLLLALALLCSGAFACASLVGFAAQTLVQQARPIWTEAAALIGVLLCALSGGAGTARLCFALRYIAAVLVLGLSLTAVPMRMPVGLFPILGAGAEPLGYAALSMLFSTAPVLMLMLPPPELTDSPSRLLIPPVRFFLVRVFIGALVGILLLFLTSTCTTYESIARSSEWGARLRMAAGNQPHEGVLQMILILIKLIAMLLLSANMICAGKQALGMVIPALRRKAPGLLASVLLLSGALFLPLLFGDAPLLIAAPLISVPTVLSAWLLGRRRRT